MGRPTRPPSPFFFVHLQVGRPTIQNIHIGDRRIDIMEKDSYRNSFEIQVHKCFDYVIDSRWESLDKFGYFYVITPEVTNRMIEELKTLVFRRRKDDSCRVREISVLPDSESNVQVNLYFNIPPQTQ